MTEIGEVVNNIMVQSFPSIVDVYFTAYMESLLDAVAEGKIEWKTIIENFYPDIEDAVSQAEKELESIKIEDEERKERERATRKQEEIDQANAAACC